MRPDVLYASHPDAAPAGDDEIGLMFSGGLDSTATALALAERFSRVHLVTYRNGYGHWRHDRSRKRAEALGDRFTFTLISTKDAFQKLSVKTIGKDYRKFGSGFVWCLGCKLVMHARSVLFCLDRGLTRMADGSNGATDEMVEQSILSLSLIRHFYEDYGIDFGTPVYNDERADHRARLAAAGVESGRTLLDRQLGIQPTCVAGELYYLPYLLLNKPVRHDEGDVVDFFAEKVPIAKELVESWRAPCSDPGA